jgi:hypothetical protein
MTLPEIVQLARASYEALREQSAPAWEAAPAEVVERQIRIARHVSVAPQMPTRLLHESMCRELRADGPRWEDMQKAEQTALEITQSFLRALIERAPKG